jgi:hypothetical protein
MQERGDRSTESRRSARRHQVDLFHPAAPRPTWESLPPAVRRTVTELLARLLADAAKRPEAVPAPATRIEEEDTHD